MPKTKAARKSKKRLFFNRSSRMFGVSVALVGITLSAGLASQYSKITNLVKAEAGVTQSWTVKAFSMSGGRYYYARVPTCTPATHQACVDYLAQPRSVVVFLHGADGAEDATTATGGLNYLSSLKANTIFAFGVSANGSKRWNAGNCCTIQPVDDVAYLAWIPKQLDIVYGVNLNKVSIMGGSNGGMMSLRAACDRPGIFKAAASFAGTYAGSCTAGKPKLAQWHGTADTMIPIGGGDLQNETGTVHFPPAYDLGNRMQAGNDFQLTVMPGVGHEPPATVYKKQLDWITSQLGS